MSKYVIDLRPDCKVVQEICESDGQVSIGAKSINYLEELNSDYINEHFGNLQDTAYQKGYDAGIIASSFVDKSDEAYQRGLNDAWEAARKLFSSMADSDIERMFPTEWNNGGFNALINLQPQKVIEKLKAYEEKQNDKFEFGDEIIDLNGVKGCVISKDNDGSSTMYALFDGCRVPQYVTQSNYRKTGKHYDIEKILEEMRHD